MSDRLRHSERGYERLLQVSSASLVVLVEGGLDLAFYSSLLDVMTPAVEWDVRQARELPVTTGGKPGLLQFYDRSRRRRQLLAKFKGKATAVIIMLDKDVDDVLRARRRSPHVVYTEYYEVENYLFAHGDVSRAVAIVARLAVRKLAGVFPQGWRAAAAATWRDWMVVCLLAQVLRVSCEVNYSVASRFNEPCDAPCTDGVFEERLLALKAQAGLPGQKFEIARAFAADVVDKHLLRNRYDGVFRGKWYQSFVRQSMTPFRTRKWSDDELLSALMLTMDFEAPWSGYLRERISATVALLQAA